MLSKAKVGILFVSGFMIVTVFWLNRSIHTPSRKSKLGIDKPASARHIENRLPDSVENVELFNSDDKKLLSFVTKKLGKQNNIDRGQAWESFERIFGEVDPLKVPIEDLRNQCKAGLVAACWMASRTYADDLSNLRSNIAFVTTDEEREELLRRLKAFEAEARVFNVAACSTGDSLSCRDARLNAGTPEMKNALYELEAEFCEIGMRDYCSVVIYGKLKDVEQSLAMLSCQGECSAEDEIEIRKVAEQAVEQGLGYCISGDAESCSTLLWEDDPREEVKARAVSALVGKCEGDEPDYCDTLFFFFKNRSDITNARKFAERGCEKGKTQSCLGLLETSGGDGATLLQRIAPYCRTINESDRSYAPATLEMCDAVEAGEMDEQSFWFRYSNTPVGAFGEPLSKFVH